MEMRHKVSHVSPVTLARLKTPSFSLAHLCTRLTTGWLRRQKVSCAVRDRTHLSRADSSSALSGCTVFENAFIQYWRKSRCISPRISTSNNADNNVLFTRHKCMRLCFGKPVSPIPQTRKYLPSCFPFVSPAAHLLRRSNDPQS